MNPETSHKEQPEKNNAIPVGKIIMDNRNTGISEYEIYRNKILHEWLGTLTRLGYTLVPLFFILDYITAPAELIREFAILRLISVAIILIQYFIIRNTKPGRFSYIHGYIVSINVGGIICFMTVLLGGFESSYYAGVNLVMIAVNMLLPWKPVHSVVNSLMMISMYVSINLLFGKAYDTVLAVNHLFFMGGTAIVSVSINLVKNKLEETEFFLRSKLKKTRDALWGEMELAKRIQTALLPNNEDIKTIGSRGNGMFYIAATMLPAEEVGGDYYDIIENPAGERWIAIGDVTGHGVESGLIMMMTQTSIYSLVNNTSGYNPSSILNAINGIIKKNITRLGVDRYMGVSLFRLFQDYMLVAGKHQDIIIYRAATKTVDVIQSAGTWIGILDKIKKYTTDIKIPIDVGDIILLFTDGVTEAMDKNGVMYGQERLIDSMKCFSNYPVEDILYNIITSVTKFWDNQDDDVTMLVIKRYE